MAGAQRAGIAGMVGGAITGIAFVWFLHNFPPEYVFAAIGGALLFGILAAIHAEGL